MVGTGVFATRCSEWLEGKGLTAAIATLVRVLLRQYPKELDGFNVWLDRTAAVLERNGSVRLGQWRHRHNRFGVLGVGGPRVLAGCWIGEDRELPAFLEESGLTELGPDAGLRREACRNVINLLSTALTRKRVQAEVLDSRLTFLLDKRAKLVSDELKPAAAHGLLSPFVDEDPPADLKATVRRFLLQTVGDPRILPGTWNPVRTEDKGVMLRWLVAETLDDFFRLLDRTALDRHWRERKAFWQVYLDMNVITDAWLVLGQHARKQGKEILGAAGGTWGQLGRGGDYSQSVLLMKLGGLTIAEWSHNGSCRVWLEGARTAPALYQRTYRRAQLSSNASDEQVRHDPNGRWKDRVARFVYRQTGIIWRPR